MMDAVSSENETMAASADANGTNGQSAPDDTGRSVHRFSPGLGDHPLWQAFMDELKAQREADIAESNRLADLELEQEKLEQEKLEK